MPQPSLRVIVNNIFTEVSGIFGVVIFHRNGLIVDVAGVEEETGIQITASINRLRELEKLVGSKLVGIDLVFEKHVAVIRVGDKVGVAILAEPGQEMELLDHLAFRVIDEVEKDFLGF